MSATHDVTQLLMQWANGSEEALDDLTPLVYKELRKLAASHLRRERKSHTLQPTVLIQEVYLRRRRCFQRRELRCWRELCLLLLKCPWSTF
jgi:hypothetical protein